MPSIKHLPPDWGVSVGTMTALLSAASFTFYNQDVDGKTLPPEYGVIYIFTTAITDGLRVASGNICFLEIVGACRMETNLSCLGQYHVKTHRCAGGGKGLLLISISRGWAKHKVRTLSDTKYILRIKEPLRYQCACHLSKSSG